MDNIRSKDREALDVSGVLNNEDDDEVYTTCSESESHNENDSNATSALLRFPSKKEEHTFNLLSSLLPTFPKEPTSPKFSDCNDIDYSTIQISKNTGSLRQPENLSPPSLSSPVLNIKTPLHDDFSTLGSGDSSNIINDKVTPFSPPTSQLSTSTFLKLNRLSNESGYRDEDAYNNRSTQECIRQEIKIISPRLDPSYPPPPHALPTNCHKNVINNNESMSQSLGVTQRLVSNSKDGNRQLPQHKAADNKQGKRQICRHYGSISNIISAYQQFLCKNRFLLKLVEDCFSRMVVLYAPFSRDEEIEYCEEDDELDRSDRSQLMVTTGKTMEMKSSNKVENKGTRIQPEIWYAILNLWGLLNDCLYYYGNGDDNRTSRGIRNIGNGLTINDEPTNSNYVSNDVFSRPLKMSSASNDIYYLQNKTTRTSSTTDKTGKAFIAITACRTVLSIVQCIEPALEVTTYHSKRNGGKDRSVFYSYPNDRHTNVLRLVSTIERIKFLCRVGVITINYWSVLRTILCASPTCSNPTIQVGKDNLSRRSRISRKRGVKTQLEDEEEIARNISISGIGILQDGGVLQPGTVNNVTRDHEERRVGQLLYVGKRTGRRIQAQTKLRPMTKKEDLLMRKSDCHHLSEVTDTRYSEELLSTKLKKKSEMTESWIKSIKRKMTILRQGLLATTAKRRLICLLMGELLYLYRPLYWVRACYNHEATRTRMQFFPRYRFKNDHMDKRKHFGLMKSWIVCLAMDVISHKLSSMGTHASTGVGDNSSRRNDGKNGSNNNISTTVDLSSQTTRDELQRRKMQWVLYLLRAPVWSLVTYPLTNVASKLFGFCIPLIGKPVATYFIDLLLYWQQWHFMLED